VEYSSSSSIPGIIFSRSHQYVVGWPGNGESNMSLRAVSLPSMPAIVRKIYACRGYITRRRSCKPFPFPVEKEFGILPFVAALAPSPHTNQPSSFFSLRNVCAEFRSRLRRSAKGSETNSLYGTSCKTAFYTAPAASSQPPASKAPYSE